jgi:GTPase SAR1 family protein
MSANNEVSSLHIPQIEMKPSIFLNKTTMVCGNAGSGKTTLLSKIVKRMVDVQPSLNVLIMCSLYSAEFYRNIVSDNCIYVDTDIDSIIKCLYEFVEKPNALLVIEDNFATKLILVNKKDPKIMKKIFRIDKKDITTIITTFSDKGICSEYRSNVDNLIFTSPQSATVNFARSSNGYSKDDKAMAEKYINHIFPDIVPKTYENLVYLRDSKHPFYSSYIGMNDDESKESM